MSGARVGGKKSSLLDFSILPDGKRRNYENQWLLFTGQECAELRIPLEHDSRVRGDFAKQNSEYRPESLL